MNLNMMKYLDMKSDNLLSSGMKIVFNNKIYNYFGFSNEREYFVIYSAREEPFFIKGSEFDKTIPISISKNRIDRSLYYKKINKCDIEDIFRIIHYSYYKDIPCFYEFTQDGIIDIKIDQLLPTCNIIPEREFLIQNGFITEYVGDNQWDSRSIFVKKMLCLIVILQ